MNRKAVQQGESTGRIRKNLQEIHEDEIMHAWMEAQTADINENADDQWIDWKEIERHVLRLQRQLAHAVEHNNRKDVRHSTAASTARVYPQKERKTQAVRHTIYTR